MKEGKKSLIGYLLKYPRLSYTIADFYLTYLSNIELGTVYDVEYKTYKDIVTDFFKILRDDLLERSKTIRLPFRLGTLTIIKKLPKAFCRKSLAVDYKETRAQGRLIFHLNEHSDYYKYRVYWSKKDAILPGKAKYQFVMSRTNKRRLAQIIKNREHDFTENY